MVRVTFKRVILGGVLTGFLIVWFSTQRRVHHFSQLDDGFKKWKVEDDQHVQGPTPNCKPTSGDACYKQGLEVGRNNFFLNGTELWIMSGSFHYFRTRPEQWDDRFKRMRAAGLNTVTTYVAWNAHEKIKNQFNFKGMYDIERFVKVAGRNGLYVIIRAGPYICAEWEFGGLPSWLLHDDNMRVRTSTYKPYINHVDNFFNKLLPRLAKLTYVKGGPIIAFQLENEFSHMDMQDQSYLEQLRDMHRKYGIQELLFTSDASGGLNKGSLKGTYATVNFGSRPKEHFDRLKNYQPNKALMTTEFWPGWFDTWGGKHQRRDGHQIANTLDAIIKQKASFNIYMFVGSTNFDFYNGGHLLHNFNSITTSYDYDAPISEYGAITSKYRNLRKVLIDNKLVLEKNLPKIPDDPKTKAYDVVTLSEYLSYSDLVQVAHKVYKGKIILKQAHCMEKLPINNGGGQGYGFILYRIEAEKPMVKLHTGYIRDHAYIILNNVLVAHLSDWSTLQKDVYVTIPAPQHKAKKYILDIFVENRGRINYSSGKNAQRDFQQQRKGINQNITIDGKNPKEIEHVPFEFDDRFIEKLSTIEQQWKSINSQELSLPTLFRGEFTVHHKTDNTFINTEAWGQGIVFINGVHLGRYSDSGPQKTMYVPGPILKVGKNQVLVFEHKIPHKVKRVKFTDTPVLG